MAAFENRPLSVKQGTSLEHSTFTALREDSQFCDAVVKIGDTEFPVHRAILSTSSPYFLGLFTTGSKKEILSIPEVAPNIMKALIEYAYTRKIEITETNIVALLTSATKNNMQGIVKLCCEFYKTNLSWENCFDVQRFSEYYFYQSLLLHTKKYIARHFSLIVGHNPGFLRLSIDELCDILASDNLNVRNELQALDAALRWIDDDRENRKTHMCRILRTLRLGLLPSQTLVKKVKAHTHVQSCQTCKRLVIMVFKLIHDLDVDNSLIPNIPLCRPRNPHELLFLIGGWNEGLASHLTQTYDVRADYWHPLVNTDSRNLFGSFSGRAYHGVSVLNNSLYIVGGFDGRRCHSSVLKYDLASGRRAEVSAMHERRSYLSVVTLQGCLYALGGFDGHERHKTAERYNPGHNQWSFVAPMHIRRSDASATVFNAQIYVCGGFDGSHIHDKVECYDPNTDQWTLLPPMLSQRSSLRIITYDDKIYALGGYNGTQRLASAEAYDIIKMEWKPVPEMYNPRGSFAIAVLDDMLFVIGGFDGFSTIRGVECFDKSTQEWYEVSSLKDPVSGVSACVVEGLPSIQSFLCKSIRG